MLSCREATHLMSQELDRDLSWSERLALRVHVTICAGCNNFRKHMNVVRRACRRFGASGPEAGDD